MLRRTPIFKAFDPTVVSSGLQPDYQELKAFLWAEGDNVRFYKGKVARNVPPELMFDLALPIRGLSQQRDQAGVRWVWAAGGDALYRWYGPAQELIYTAPAWVEDQNSLYDATFWDFVHWGDWTIFNTSTGRVQIYKPGIGVAPLGDSPSDVVSIQKKLNFVLAIGFGDRGTRVGWSDSDNIDDWTATDENLAGALSIDDFDTRIKASNRLGASIAVYAEDQLALVSYISAPFYFGQKVVLDGIGAVGKYSVTGDGTSNYGVGRNGVWWTDGITSRYIDDFLHDYLQKGVNWDQSSKIVAARNDVTNCIDFYFPMGESLTISEGWSYDPQTGGWSKLPPVALQVERKLFNRPLVGRDDGHVMRAQGDPTVAAPLNLVTKPILIPYQDPSGLSDAHIDSRVDEVELFVKIAVGVEFRVGSATKVEDAFEFTPWIVVQNRAATYTLPNIPSGVYWKLAFRSVVDEWDLDLQGFMLYGAVEGTKRGSS